MFHEYKFIYSLILRLILISMNVEMFIDINQTLISYRCMALCINHHYEGNKKKRKVGRNAIHLN